MKTALIVVGLLLLIPADHFLGRWLGSRRWRK